MATSSWTSNDGDLREIGSTNGPHHQQDNSEMTKRAGIVKDRGCIDDSELSEIGSGVGPNELQKIAVRYLKIPQPAIDTYKASAR